MPSEKGNDPLTLKPVKLQTSLKEKAWLKNIILDQEKRQEEHTETNVSIVVVYVIPMRMKQFAVKREK